MIQILSTNNKIILIDKEDYLLVSQYGWHARKEKRRNTAYASTQIKNSLGEKSELKIHRLIMGVKDSNIKIDHINGNGLDNRKINLRVCGQGQNCMNRRLNKNNTSGYKGVEKTGCKKWVVRIGINNKRIYLGTFTNKNEAALAYNKAAIKYFGEFAKLNEIVLDK